MTIVKLDCRRITDWDSFHDYFQELFGFPNYYGRNMNAWIDLMSTPEDLVIPTSLGKQSERIIVLHLEHARDLKSRQPEIFESLITDAAVCNCRNIEAGEKPVLAMSYDIG